jgi:hypothetical protein
MRSVRLAAIRCSTSVLIKTLRQADSPGCVIALIVPPVTAIFWRVAVGRRACQVRRITADELAGLIVIGDAGRHG